ncbi:MAG: polysaccharide deacetylase family protein [Lachnospiraceae bacterium]|nr:polysaccharide deacetylase family protein [Lachnospiraceae bacterium]
MKKAYISFPGGCSKALTMSYDDGKEEDRRLIDIFNANGIKATFNLNYGLMVSDPVNKDHVRIPVADIKELYKGHEIATHTYTHPTLARCPLTEVAYEILEDRKGLESITGKPVRGHAYPNGSYSDEIKVLFKELGIAYARVTATDTSFSLPVDPYEWKPTAHHNDPELMDKAQFFVDFKKYQYLKLMYVWGHSYEFADRDNWDVIERFAETVGRKDDIWYATNIEIIDYMDAAKRLQFGADNGFVYNPSALTVCLDIDGHFAEVGAGELKEL